MSPDDLTVEVGRFCEVAQRFNEVVIGQQGPYRVSVDPDDDGYVIGLYDRKTGEELRGPERVADTEELRAALNDMLSEGE